MSKGQLESLDFKPDPEVERILQSGTRDASEKPADEMRKEFSDSVEDETCAICFETIHEDQAVMRCETQGKHHYFHTDPCMITWLKTGTYEDNKFSRKCPMCRGEMEIHSSRLSEYLSGSDLDDENRRVLEDLLKNTDSSAGWTKAWFTQENVVAVASYTAAIAMGFYAGYSNSIAVDILADTALQSAPRSYSITYTLSCLAGMLTKSIFSKKDDRDSDAE